MSLIKVRYKGLSDVREMSKKDLAAAGAGVDGTMRWDANNRKTLFVRNPDDRLLEIFKAEGTFQVEEVSEDNLNDVRATIIEGEALDDTGQTIVNGVTGQRSEAGERDANADPVPSGSEAGKSGKSGKTGRGSSTD